MRQRAGFGALHFVLSSARRRSANARDVHRDASVSAGSFLRFSPFPAKARIASMKCTIRAAFVTLFLTGPAIDALPALAQNSPPPNASAGKVVIELKD